MTIKHLVISGGGPVMFRAMGALEKLEQENFWERKNINTVYSTTRPSGKNRLNLETPNLLNSLNLLKAL